jgi:hypothetical protein
MLQVTVETMGVLEKVHAGWTIRRERLWWDWACPIVFRWSRPNGRKADELTKDEHREMTKLGETKILGPIASRPRADPPYDLIGLAPPPRALKGDGR